MYVFVKGNLLLVPHQYWKNNNENAPDNKHAKYKRHFLGSNIGRLRGGSGLEHSKNLKY